jgi:hypothetical protein
VVEPAFSSASIKTGELSTSKFGDDVELHVRSDNVRDISKLAENPGERESLSPPGTQLLVHERRLEITPEGRRKWVIEAEEIGPGHPRYLDPDAAQQKMAERRAENDHNAAEFDRRKQESIAERLGGLNEPVVEHHRPSVQNVQNVHDVLDGPAEPPVVHEPQPDHSSLARATNPPAEPAIHAGATTPEERAAYVHDRHPHLREVNPGFHEPGALDNGYVSNCTRGPEAYWDRLHGGDATAEPIPLHEMGTRGTLEHIEGRFGETFSGRASYDDVIREMRERPVDHHAVVAVKYDGPNGVEYGHVAMVVHTRDGVAFIDPQSGDLMHLPHPPKDIKLLHVGTPGAEHVPAEHFETGTHSGGYGMTDPAAERFLGREDLQAALAHPELADARVEMKDELGRAHDLGPLRDYLEAELPRRPELARLLNDEANAYIVDSLVKRPQALGNLLAHDEAVRIFEDSLRDVHEQREHGTLPEPIADEPQHLELGETERRVSHEATEDNARYEDADRRQPEYPREHLGNETEFKNYLDHVYDRAEVAMQKLREVVPEIATETEGEPDLRKTLKGRSRAEDKIESNYGGDPSRLTDIAGGIVRFEKIEMLYAALEKIRARDDIEIVEFEDRFVKPQPAGYSDLQMKVRIDGHVAEFRLHLKAVDAVSAYDHSLYEVRRDLKAKAVDEGPGPDPETGKKRARPYTDEERALIDALLKREREKFWEALNKRPEP